MRSAISGKEKKSIYIFFLFSLAAPAIWSGLQVFTFQLIIYLKEKVIRCNSLLKVEPYNTYKVLQNKSCT